MTKKEILQKVATMQSLMAGAKGTSGWVTDLKRGADTGLSTKSGPLIGKIYNGLKTNNSEASKFFSKTNFLSNLFLGPAPVPGGIAVGLGLKTGINATHLANKTLVRNPKLMDIFQKGLNIGKTIIPT